MCKNLQPHLCCTLLVAERFCQSALVKCEKKHQKQLRAADLFALGIMAIPCGTDSHSVNAVNKYVLSIRAYAIGLFCSINSLWWQCRLIVVGVKCLKVSAYLANPRKSLTFFFYRDLVWHTGNIENHLSWGCQYYDMLCYVALYILCYVMLYHVMLCYILCYVRLCWVMSFLIMPYHDILC